MEYTQIPQNTFRPIKEGYDKLQSLSVQRRINITSPIPDSPLSPRPSKYSRSFIFGCETTGSRQSSRADSIVQSCSRPNSSNLYFKSNNSSNSDISVAKNFQDLSVSNRRAAFKTQKWSHSLDQACLNSSPSGAKRRQASLQQKSLDLDSGYLGSPSSGLLSAQSQPWIDLPSTNHCPEPGKDSVSEIDKARKELAKLINFQETESMNRSLSLPSFTQSFHNRSLHEHIQEYCNQNPIPEPSPSHDELDALDEEIKRIVGDLQSPESYTFSSSTLNHDLNKECVKPTPIRSSTRTFSPSVTKESEEFLYVKTKDSVYSPLCNSEEKIEYNTKKDKPLKQNLGIDNVEDCPVMLAVVRTVSQKYDVPREDYSKGIDSQLFSSNSYLYPGSNQPSKSQILESLPDEKGQGCFLFTSTPVIQTVKKELSQPTETNCDIFQPQSFFDKNGDANLHTQGVKHVQYNDIQSLLSNNIQDPYENNVGETEKTNSVEDNSVCESRRPDELHHFIFKKTSQFSGQLHSLKPKFRKCSFCLN